MFFGNFCDFCDFQEGGGNFLIDGYQILKDLEADPETRSTWDGWDGKVPVKPGNSVCFQ